MTLEQIKAEIPKTRLAQLEQELILFIDKVIPILDQYIAVEKEDLERKEHYARLKVQPEWISAIMEEMIKTKSIKTYNGFFKTGVDLIL